MSTGPSDALNVAGQPRDRIAARDVGLEAGGAAAGCFGNLFAACRASSAWRLQVRNVGPSFGQRTCHRQAQALRSAGHQRSLAINSEAV